VHRGGHSGLNSLFKMLGEIFSATEQDEYASTSSYDLNVLEREIGYLRASIFTLNEKKKI